jgi:hypothetical protein
MPTKKSSSPINRHTTDKRSSGLTLNKPRLSGSGVEGLTYIDMESKAELELWL